MSAASYLHHLDRDVAYALNTAAGKSSGFTPVSDALAHEINHLIAVVQIAQLDIRSYNAVLLDRRSLGNQIACLGNVTRIARQLAAAMVVMSLLRTG